MYIYTQYVVYRDRRGGGGGVEARERERELFGLMPILNRSSRGVKPLDFPQPTTVQYMWKPGSLDVHHAQIYA